MKTFHYTLFAASPLYVGAGKPYRGNFMESLNFIPGGLIRGAIASLLLEECAEDKEQQQGSQHSHQTARCKFYQLLGPGDSPEVIFTPCYPVGKGVLSRQVWSLPMTARSCKSFPGFRTDEIIERKHPRLGQKIKERHGVFDLLIRHLIIDETLGGPEGLPFIPKERCPSPKCGGRVEPFQGFYQRLETGYTQMDAAAKARFVRVAINRRRNTAEEGMLYSLEVIAEGQEFRGSVLLPSEKSNLLQESLRRVQEKGWIGGGSSRGLGRVEVRILGEEEQPGLAPLKDRAETFNEVVKRQRGALACLWGTSSTQAASGIYFTLGLQSDAILEDEFGGPTTILYPSVLWRELGLSGKLVEPELVRSYTGATYLSGWSVAWGLPRETAIGVRRGSVFVYQIGELSDELIGALEALEDRGIGRRREEGFGRAIVCDPFHLEVEPI